MNHWAVDLDALELLFLKEAFPGLKLLSRSEVSGFQHPEGGVFWLRLKAGQDVSTCLPLTHAAEFHVVLLCDEPDESVVVSALAAGAAGCCNSRAAPEVLQQVALVVGNGGLWVGQSLLQKLVGATARALAQRPATEAPASWRQALSEREIQVAERVAAGDSNKEIARVLDITERTVKAHLSTIFEKLGIRDRLQLSLRVNGL